MMNRFLAPEEIAALGLAKVGRNVSIDRAAILIQSERIEIGDNSRIDAFALITGGAGVRIGRNVHIGAGSYIFGGGGVTLGDFAGLSSRVAIYSSGEDYSGEVLTNPTAPREYLSVTDARVTLGRHVVVGTGSTILPGVTIGDGAAVGAMSLVKQDVEAFTIVAGIPSTPLKERRRGVLAMEQALLQAEARAPTLQVHIPISPTPSFFTMVGCLAASMRAFGGRFSEARFVVSVGEDCEPFDIAAARPDLADYNITWRWVDREAFRNYSYFATGIDRWAEPFTADYVLMADADILVLKPFDDLIERMAAANADVAGCIASRPPFSARQPGDDDRVRWPELFAFAGLETPHFPHRIPGHGVLYPREGMEFAPPYYNFGFVLGKRDAMNAVRRSFESDYYLANDYMKTDLAGQAGLCLAIVRQGLRALDLPVRYNFWDHPAYVREFGDERDDVRVFHYKNGAFKKHKDNDTVGDISRWVDAHLESEDPLERFTAQCFRQVLGVTPTQLP